MAGSGTAQERLDKIVKLIAAEMVAEVCSCYLMRAGEVLELFATVGLNPRRCTRRACGSAKVSSARSPPMRRSLALSNAPSHPNFAYRPETGEDPVSVAVRRSADPQRAGARRAGHPEPPAPQLCR
jgi:phosphotransferase system enzyme I (PtsP)